LLIKPTTLPTKSDYYVCMLDTGLQWHAGLCPAAESAVAVSAA